MSSVSGKTIPASAVTNSAPPVAVAVIVGSPEANASNSTRVQAS